MLLLNQQVKVVGGCSTCKRIRALLLSHAKQCKTCNCHVPYCMEIRKRLVSKLKQRQQEMHVTPESRQRNINDPLNLFHADRFTRYGASTALFLVDDSDNS